MSTATLVLISPDHRPPSTSLFPLADSPRRQQGLQSLRSLTLEFKLHHSSNPDSEPSFSDGLPLIPAARLCPLPGDGASEFLASHCGRMTSSGLSYLDRVVMEIVETERMYVRDLRMIVEDYLSHIIDQSGVSLSPDQVVSLFGNIEDIYEFNSELLQCLDLCDKDPVAVARCFVTKREDFRIYTQFCNNYPNSVAALTNCMRNKTLAKFFREQQAALQKPLPLGSYLLKPVQRILKYHLLLQEIAKNFHQEDQGFDVIEEAICTMTGVACYINDMKRKHEHAVRLQEVQSLLVNWKGLDLTTYGELVLEGTFKLHGAKNQRTLFLFQQLLLITRRRADHFVYKTHISCSTLMLIDTKDSRSFSVTHYKRPKKPHTVQARSVEERELWAHHIKRIILENHHAVIPQKDKDSLMNPRYPARYRLCQDGPRTLVPTEGSQERQSVIQEVRRGGVRPMRNDITNILSVFEVKKEASQPRPLPEGAEPAAPQVLPVSVPEGSEQGCALDPLRNPEMEVEESALEVRDSRAMSSGESSEDDDQEKDSPRILPPSVLNHARDIANHVSSVRRPSRVQGDWHQTHSSTERFGGRSTNQDAEPPAARGLRSEPDGVAGSPERYCYSDSGGRHRRDSFLTRHDRLLIGKIKSYYESAATHDSSFGLQRRESLSHIPTGLVRTSVSRLNNAPLHAACPTSEAYSSPLSHTVSSQSLDSLVSDPTGSDSVEEEFRASSEMMRIWQTPELNDVAGKLILASEPSESWDTHHKQNQNQTLDSVSEELKMPLAVKPIGRQELLKDGSKNDTSLSGDHRAAWAKSEPEQSDAADDRAESRVLHLARCYSQRLRGSRPAVSVRSPEVHVGPRTLPSLSEEGPADKPAQILNTTTEPAHHVTRTHHPAGFHWPDVRELCSKYSDHNPSASLDLKSLSCGAGTFRPEQSPELDPSISRGDGPDPQLSPTSSNELEPILEGRSREPVVAEAVLTRDPEHIGLEKVPGCETGFDNSGVEEQTYVQIRSPTSREKISILAVVDRCRAYQDSQEYRQREATAASDVQDERTARPKTPAEQNLVKNLREKFLKFQ